MTGTAWPSQPPVTSGAMQYGGHPAYSAQPYGSGYYRGSVTQPPTPTVKAEEAQATSPAMPYGGQYSTAYPNMQRNGSQSTSSMGQARYQPPMQQPSSGNFNAMTARASFGGQPPASGQPAQGYGNAPSQQYAVRSPTQSYGMQSAPGSAVPQSPHPPSVKSPHPGAGPDGQSQMSYRSGSYAVANNEQPGPTGHDLSGLGINGNAGYPPQPQQGQDYQSYASSGHAYRPVNEIATAQGAGHYAP